MNKPKIYERYPGQLCHKIGAKTMPILHIKGRESVGRAVHEPVHYMHVGTCCDSAKRPHGGNGSHCGKSDSAQISALHDGRFTGCGKGADCANEMKEK